MAVTLGELESNCKKTVEHFKKELSRLRTGRAHTSLLDGITVDYYGSQTPLIQLGMVSVPESRMITIQTYDPSAVEAIEKAIRSSELGLNPSHDGGLVRVILPLLTEDRRKDLVKKANKIAEEQKIALRTHRRDTNELVKKQEKNKEISVDESKKAQDQVQVITDKYTKEIDVLVAAKEKEILEV